MYDECLNEHQRFTSTFNLLLDARLIRFPSDSHLLAAINVVQGSVVHLMPDVFLRRGKEVVKASFNIGGVG